MSKLPVFFNITLAPRTGAEQWNVITQRFARTLNSVLRQTDPNFRVFLAAHETPDELALLDDPRIDIEIVSEPRPSDLDSARLDKRAKRSANLRRIQRFGDGYTMFLDADDIVSNRLVEFVRRFQEQHGYVFWGGYLYDPKLKRAAPFRGQRKLSNFCGSCAAVRFMPADHRGSNPYVDRFFAGPGGHPGWEQTARKERRPLSPVMKPLVAYVIHDHQLSIEAVPAGRPSDRPEFYAGRKWVAGMMSRTSFDVDEDLRSEFGMD